MKKIDYKKLIILIIGTIVIGSFFSLFISKNNYSSFIKPILSPPGYIFPIVWTILYTLMGISLYLVSESYGNKKVAYILYLYQLLANSIWTLLFFGLNLRLLSFFWIILIIILVVLMIREFLRFNKTAAYLQIPYLLWLVFASYLNLSIYLLNR